MKRRKDIGQPKGKGRTEMADEKPDTDAPEGSTSSTETPETREPEGTSEVPPGTEAEPEAPEWSPDSLPEVERERAKAWATKHAEEHYASKAGREGSWMRSLSQDDREELKANPQLLRQLRERLAAASASQGAPEKKDAESDPVERVRSKLNQKWKLQPETEGLVTDLVSEVLAEVRQEFASTHSRMTREEIGKAQIDKELSEIRASKEWADEDFKARFFGIAELNKQADKFESPAQVYARLRAKMKAPSTPVRPVNGRPNFGDTSTTARTASPDSSGHEAFEQEMKRRGLAT
jgi:hypothetical protein